MADQTKVVIGLEPIEFEFEGVHDLHDLKNIIETKFSFFHLDISGKESFDESANLQIPVYFDQAILYTIYIYIYRKKHHI